MSKHDPLYRLRWVTLGYHHNWDTKEYSDSRRSLFPPDLAELTACVAEAVGFPKFVAEAAIVNYYHLDSTLSGHTDHSEKDLSLPLVSISFGLSAIFLIGGQTRETRPTALLLRSGDVVIMSQESRLSYHAVPRVLPHVHELSAEGKEGEEGKEGKGEEGKEGKGEVGTTHSRLSQGAHTAVSPALSLKALEDAATIAYAQERRLANTRRGREGPMEMDAGRGGRMGGGGGGEDGLMRERGEDVYTCCVCGEKKKEKHLLVEELLESTSAAEDSETGKKSARGLCPDPETSGRGCQPSPPHARAQQQLVRHECSSCAELILSWPQFVGYLSVSRINVNVRQVLSHKT